MLTKYAQNGNFAQDAVAKATLNTLLTLRLEAAKLGTLRLTELLDAGFTARLLRCSARFAVMVYDAV